MSKYIKLEDAIRNINLEVTGRKEYTGDMKANLFFALDDLPTIEVSEDCISREWLLRALNGYGKDWQEDCEIADVIRNAPSVTTEQSCDTCKHNNYAWDSEECDGCTKANSNWERIEE